MNLREFQHHNRVETYQAELAGGTATYSDASGKLEMIAYHRNPDHSTKGFQEMMKMRRLLRAVNVLNVVKSDWGNGWLLKPKTGNQWFDQWTRWTLYLDGSQESFSLYEAIPDIDKAIDVEDERLLLRSASPLDVITRIKCDLKSHFLD